MPRLWWSKGCAVVNAPPDHELANTPGESFEMFIACRFQSWGVRQLEIGTGGYSFQAINGHFRRYIYALVLAVYPSAAAHNRIRQPDGG